MSKFFHHEASCLRYLLLVLAMCQSKITQIEVKLKDFHIPSNISINEKLIALNGYAEKSILIHEHIPKAGGTALSLALASECRCAYDGKIGSSICNSCPIISGTKSFKSP